MYRGKYSPALELFERAYDLDRLPMYLFNISVAQLNCGKCTEAVRSLQRLIDNPDAHAELVGKATKLLAKARSQQADGCQ